MKTRTQRRGLEGHHITSYHIKDVMHTFYRGYSKEVVDRHPADGSEGLLILFIDQDRVEEIDMDGHAAEGGNNHVVFFQVVPDRLMKGISNTDDHWIDFFKERVYENGQITDVFKISGSRRVSSYNE